MNLSSRRLLLLILATFAIVAAACGSESAVDQAPVSIPDPGDEDVIVVEADPESSSGGQVGDRYVTAIGR